MVPTEATVSQATSRSSVWAARAPSTPSTLVARASGRSRGSAASAESPASGPNTTPCTRRMAYTPTLVMMANRAATGAAAAAYVAGSHIDNGASAALKPKTTSSTRPAACTTIASGPCTMGTRRARSAKFKVPVRAYSKDTPIRNSAEASRFSTT